MAFIEIALTSVKVPRAHGPISYVFLSWLEFEGGTKKRWKGACFRDSFLLLLFLLSLRMI